MKRHTYVALLATLLSATAWGQEVSLYGTTMAQMWKEGTGVDKATFTPATQYLGIDATKLGTDNLSLHLFGWGRKDLSEATGPDGSKSDGNLNYGYLHYRFNQANAEIKAGRFTANQSTGFEQIDGVSARTDLVNGFTVSAFAGRPVVYKVVDPRDQKDYNFQHDFIFGTRIGLRVPQVGEIGLSYLQDGSKAARDLDIPSPVDYTRKRLGMDVLLSSSMAWNLRGRTVYDVSQERSNVAEHDYTATVKLGEQVSASGGFTERNFKFYFAGTNLPSLFRQDDSDAFKSWNGNVTWNTAASFQVLADYRHMHRESFGDVNRFGGEMRWFFNDKAVLLGLGAHWANAVDTKFVDPKAPSRSLSHKEARIWTMATKGKFTASLDAILQRYEPDNQYLAGLRNVWETVASLGYQATSSIKVSGDVSVGSTPVSKHETRALLRAEYRFGFAKKGGK